MEGERSGVNWYQLDQGQRLAAHIAEDQVREVGTLAEATNQRLKIDVAHGLRRADQLEVGEVVIEPNLGPARVIDVDRGDGDGFIRLSWKDDRGPGMASGRYRADQQLHVRMPGPRDLTYIQRAVDQAVWNRRNVPGKVARLIAAHLHPGHSSRVYRFAIDGSIGGDFFYEEVEELHRQRESYRPWIQALVRYCVGRDDQGPEPGWLVERDVEEFDREPKEPPSAEKPQLTERTFLVSRYVAAATVRQLLDAAFDLGVKAARSRSPSAALTKLARARVRSSQRRTANIAGSPGHGPDDPGGHGDRDQLQKGMVTAYPGSR